MKLARGALLLVATLFVVTACADVPEPSPSPTPTPTPTQVAPSPSPSPTPSPDPSPTAFQSFPPPPPGETEEQAAIRQGWEAYNHTLDKFLRDPSLTDLTETQYVTTGEEQNGIIDDVMAAREANVHIGGDQLFRDVVVGVPAEVDGVREATVTSCFDPTHQLVVDSTTNEPYEDARAETFVAHDRLEQGPDLQWRVAEHRTEDVRC